MRHLISFCVLVVGSLVLTWTAASLFESKALARAATAQAGFIEPHAPSPIWDRPIAQTQPELRTQ